MGLPHFVEGMLSGVRILDLTRVLAGPYATLLLSDLGAEVIKIEEPSRGDTTRTVGTSRLEGLSAYFVSVNRNKLSMTLDLKSQKGREVFHELVGKADVVINNYRPTVLERLGCDSASLREANASIVNCAISGFGQTGAYRDWPAYDLIVQGMGGGMDLTGYPDGDPAVMGLHIGDQAGGLFGAFAIASALYHRERTGEGQDIDIGMLDCQISLLAFLGQSYLLDGTIPGRTGTAHPVVAPLKAFKTADGFITVVAHQGKHWERLCKAVGKPEWLKDRRFATVNLRAENKEALYESLDGIFLDRPSSEWLEKLHAEGIPCGPVRDVAEALADEQVRERNMVVDQENGLGEYRILGNPIKTSAQTDTEFGPPPRFGEHTDLILKTLLGKSTVEIGQLRDKGVI